MKIEQTGNGTRISSGGATEGECLVWLERAVVFKIESTVLLCYCDNRYYHKLLIVTFLVRRHKPENGSQKCKHLKVRIEQTGNGTRVSSGDATEGECLLWLERTDVFKIESTVLLGYCDNRYYHKLLIVTVLVRRHNPENGSQKQKHLKLQNGADRQQHQDIIRRRCGGWMSRVTREDSYFRNWKYSRYRLVRGTLDWKKSAL